MQEEKGNNETNKGNNETTKTKDIGSGGDSGKSTAEQNNKIRSEEREQHSGEQLPTVAAENDKNDHNMSDNIINNSGSKDEEGKQSKDKNDEERGRDAMESGESKSTQILDVEIATEK